MALANIPMQLHNAEHDSVIFIGVGMYGSVSGVKFTKLACLSTAGGKSRRESASRHLCKIRAASFVADVTSFLSLDILLIRDDLRLEKSLCETMSEGDFLGMLKV